MKKDFLKNNKIIKFHLLINRKMIAFIIIFWLVITCALLSFTLIGLNENFKTPTIGDHSLETRFPNNSGSSTRILISISQILRWSLFSGPGIVFFSIFIIYLINKTFIKEINTSQINVWISQPISRNQLFLTKISFILLSCFLVFIPSFVVILIFSGISYDAKEYISLIFLYGIQMMIFIIMLISIYSIIMFACIEKGVLGSVLCSLIAFWIIATWIITITYEMSNGELSYLKFGKYIAPQSLMVDVLKFSQNNIESSISMPLNGNEFIINSYEKENINILALVLLMILMPIISSIASYVNSIIFYKKDLNI